MLFFKYPLTKRFFLFLTLDTLTLLFSLAVAVFVGNQFQPNPIGFLITFIGSRFLLYGLWLHSINKPTIPWLRLSIQTIILITLLPVLFAALGLLFPGVSDNTYLFIFIPTVTLITSGILHNLYVLIEEKH